MGPREHLIPDKPFAALWQRGLMIEYALIASFVAFTIVQFVFVVGFKAS